MTIKEIASLAGVSISTVSKIVNNKDQNINPKTRQRVLQIVKEYNYTPYSTVKSLSNSRSFLIGVLLCTATKTNRMLNGILQSAQEHGYNILLFDSGNCPDTELRNITALCKNKIDGLIWEPVNNNSCRHEHYFTDQNISISYINHPGSLGYSIDFTQMGYALTKKLIDYKHTNIVCLLKENSRRSQMVFDGFRKCLYDHEIPFNQKMKLYLSDAAYFSQILNGDITGIVSSHFASSLDLYEQMDKLHYYVPSDFSLVSLKDDVREAISFPRISSIRIPYQEFGTYVCRNLIEKCEKKEEAETPPDFTVNYAFDHEDSLNIPTFFRSKKIVVVGSIHIDITFNVDWLPQAGKTTTILNSTTALGGKGANQSVGVAKLGHEVSLIGEIGNDPDYSFIFDTLEKEQVTTRGIHRDMKTETGKAYIYIERDGEGTITLLSGANSSLSPEYIQKQQHLFKNAGYCLLSTEIPLPTVLKASEIARAYGARNIVKPAALKTIPDSLLQNIDIFIPNRKEAATLCPHLHTIEEQADYFFRKGIHTVIITLGHNGCYLKTSEMVQYFPAADFIATDTTGGADAFISALASYLIDGYPLEKSIRIANYAAGFCISRQGVVPSLVDHNTLETHIKRLEPELL